MSVQLGLEKQVLVRLFLPYSGAAPLRLCSEQQILTEEILKNLFNNIMQGKGSFVADELRWCQFHVDSAKRNSYSLIWGKFFKDLKVEKFGNPYVMLDPAKMMGFAELVEKKAKDHATLVLWNRIAKGIKGEPKLDKVSEIRDWMGDKKNAQCLQRITALCLVGLGLKIVPEEIKWLTNLDYLDLRGNKIKTFPAKFEGNAKLERLVLDSNLIQSMPVRIEGLESLQVLSLDSNLIRSFPKKVEGLSNVYWMSAMDNPVGCIPSSIEGMSNLKLFDRPMKCIKTGGCQIV